MNLQDLSYLRLRTAIVHSGVPETVAGEVALDFQFNRYWNDPKCVARRISVAGGDPVTFFDNLPEVDWDN